MGALSSLMGSVRAKRRPSAAEILYGEISKETPEAAQGYLEKEIGSLTSAAMPAFNSRLQDVQEGAIRRGLYGGNLPTSYEGDLASAFQKNIANTAVRMYVAVATFP